MTEPTRCMPSGTVGWTTESPMKTLCAVTIPAASPRLRQDVLEFLRSVARLRLKKKLPPLSVPLIVKIVRLGPQRAAADILSAEVSEIRSAVYEFLGLPASDVKRVTWLVEHEAEPDCRIRIEFGTEQAIDSKEIRL